MINLILKLMENEALKTAFLKLANMSISASWLVLAILVLRLVLKKAPKWVNVLLWGIVAVRLICPFTIESALSLIPSTQTIPMNIEMAAKPAIDSGVEAVNSMVNPIIAASFTPNPAASANPLQIWIPLAAVIWAFGMVLMFLYTAISYWRLNRRIDTAVLYRDNIFQSEHVSSPFVLGIIKPKIYLQFHMNEQDLQHVIAHEQAHIRRKDHWWKPLGFMLLTIHWFNPLMWLAYVMLCRDIELACDEKVIKELNSEQRADYTQALVDCSVNRRMIAACPLAFGEVNVKERVKSIMNYRKPAFWLIILAAMACIAVVICFLTNPIESNRLLMGAEYEIADMLYSHSPVYEENFVPAEKYCVTADYHLYEMRDEAENWSYLGKLEQYPLTNKELYSYNMEGWHRHYPLRRITDSYILRVEEDFLYLVFRTKNGNTYLAYGWEDTGERGEGASDDTGLRRLYRLESRFAAKHVYDSSFIDRSLINTVGKKVDSFCYYERQEFPGYAVVGFMADGDFQSNMTDMGFAVFQKSEDYGYRLLDCYVYDNAALMDNGIYQCSDPVVYGEKATNKNTFDVILSCNDNLAKIERLYYQDDQFLDFATQVVDGEYGMSLFSWEKEEKGNRVEQRYYDHDGNIIEDNGLRILTLNDVIILSQMGDALSWKDFDPYAYVEVGFGFYIRNYPINDYYALLIGASAAEREPMYFLLKNRLTDESIDIREGSVSEFLEKQNQEIVTEAPSGTVFYHDKNKDGTYQLTIPVEGIYCIQTVVGRERGTVERADDMAFEKGEKVHLAKLDKYKDLSGLLLLGLGEKGEILFSLSIPEPPNVDPITAVFSDGWVLCRDSFSVSNAEQWFETPDSQKIEEYVLDYTYNQLKAQAKKSEINVLSISDHYALLRVFDENPELIVYHYTHSNISGDINITGISREKYGANDGLSINHFQMDNQHIYFGMVRQVLHQDPLFETIKSNQNITMRFVSVDGETFETAFQNNSCFLTTLNSPLADFEILDEENNTLLNLETFLAQGYAVQEKSMLIAALGTNGARGFVKAEDLDGELPSNPEEAVAYMEEMERKTGYGTKKYVRLIPLYAADGVTVIGEFAVG